MIARAAGVQVPGGVAAGAAVLTHWDVLRLVYDAAQVFLDVPLPPQRIVFAALVLADVVSSRVHLVQFHEQLHEQLHNFNSQTANSLPNSLVSFSENSLSQSYAHGEAAKT
jgi:hypothetical protein